MKEGLIIIKHKLADLLSRLAKFADEYKDLPTLGFTHFQPAQLTTVGKRATLWMQDFYFDYLDVCELIDKLMMLGVKGTTGTQASFMDLFEGDTDKVKALDRKVCEKMGFEKAVPVSGQTYTRKMDYKVLAVLAGIAESAHKMTNDIRLLQHLKEIEEPFEKKQIGSSAMAYKRNPMRSERIASLSRYVVSNTMSAAMTASTQWFERTLDDSANRRLILPESFMAIDAVLEIATNVCSGLVVYREVINSHIMAEIPFMATENIIMESVKKGGDRQELHEEIRQLSMQASQQVKEFGKPNDLLDRIAKDPMFGLSEEDVSRLTNPSDYIGRSSQQVSEFLAEYIKPVLEDNKEYLGHEVVLNV
jgi:adenylosuccinate lyase